MAYFFYLIGARPVRLVFALLLALAPLLARASSPSLTIVGTVPAGNVDATVFLDQVEVIDAYTGAVVSNTIGSSAIASFETGCNEQYLNAHGYVYGPSCNQWGFVDRYGNANNSGLVNNGSVFGNPNAPDGTRAAFIQTTNLVGAINTVLSLPSGSGYYYLRLKAAQRNFGAGNQGFRLLVGGRDVGGYVPPNDGAYHTYTSNVFAVDALLTFEGLGSSTTPQADVTVFIDNVELLDASTGTAGTGVAGLVTQAGFETTGSLGSGSFGYNPTGTWWTFAGSSGIATNGSAFGNPTAPEGTHVALVQGNAATGGGGFISQQMGVSISANSGNQLAMSGTYRLRLRASQRNTSPADQSIAVRLDGVLIATFSPTNRSAYETLTADFTVGVPPLPRIASFTPVRGAVGSTFSIIGSNLTNVTSVVFTGGGVNVPASGFTSNPTGTRIDNIQVPSGAQSGPLLVTTTRGNSAPSGANFLVCRIEPNVAVPAVPLTAAGTASVAASAFVGSSRSTCGGNLTATLVKGGVAYGLVPEGSGLALTVPAGYRVTGVDFASYGTPTGTDGIYTQGSCHAPNTQSVVESRALGVVGPATISLPAGNTGTYGPDPCPNTPKQLAVRLVCTPTSSATPAATLTYSCTELGSQAVLVTLTEDGTGATTTVPVIVNVGPAATMATVGPSPALVGQTVTVTGTDLAQATGLTVNGATAAISNLTATGFTFVVPAGAASTGNLVLSTACSRSVTRPFGILPTISSFTPTSGQGISTTISLAGAKLTGATAITFTGSSGNVATTGFTVSADGTSITGIVVPAGVRTGPITVTTPSGTSAASTQFFSVMPLTISSLIPATGLLGSSVALSGTGFLNTVSIAFAGSSNNVVTAGFTVSADGTSITGIVVPSGAQTGPITVTRAGATSAASSQSFTVCRIVAAVQNPTLTLDASGTATIAASAFNNSSTSTCGSTVTATIARSVYGTVAENGTLTLTAPAGTTFTSVDFASYGNPTVANGTYALGSCHATSSQQVVEAALLGRTGAVSIGASNANFGGDPCPGTAKQLTVRAICTFSGASNNNAIAYTCSEVGAQLVQLTLTDAASGARATVPVTVNVVAPPAATIATLSPSPALPGQTVSATGTNLAQATALTVNGAAAAISGLTNTGFSFVVPAGATATGSVVLSVPCTAATRAFAVLPVISSFTPTSGVAGTTVSLTGTGLTGATAITFGGSSNNVVTSGFSISADGTQITGIAAPAGVQTGALTVTTPAGTSAASSQVFTLTQPTIASFTPTIGGANSIVSLTGTYLTGTTTITFSGTSGNLVVGGFTVSTDGTSITGIVVPPGAQTGPLAIATSWGASAVSAQSFTVCQLTPRVRNLTVTLGANGTATVPASAFDNGSTSSCSGTLTLQVQKGGLVYGSAPENSLVTLTAPPTFVFTNVYFASYGNPIDYGNGNYAIGSCHAANSQSMVDRFFLGQTGTISINAHRFNFGDPCVGTAKRLAVRVAYTRQSGPAAAITYDCSEVGTQPVLLTVTDAAGSSTMVQASVTVVAPPVATIGSVSTSSALPGQTVTVTGTNLSGTSAVTVNGAAATISALTGTSVSFVVPNGAAPSGSLVLSVPCTPVSVPFTVRPIISSFTPTSGVAGNTISLTGGGVIGTTAITFTGSSNNVVTSGFTVSADGTTITGIVVPSGVQTGPLTVTTPSGTSAASSQVFTMTRPVIDNLTPTSGILGTPIALTGTFLTGATAIAFSGSSNNVVTSGFTVNAAGTQITGIVVPSGAQSGPLTVTTPIATSLPSSQSFTVCRIVPVVQTPVLTLDANGTGTIAAGAFNNGSTSTCGGPVVVTAIRKGGVTYSSAQQDNVFTLAAPAGYVFTSVDFASYGQPIDNGNGNYVIGSCHSANSQSIVEGLVLGRNYVSIGPNNAMFGGSPCGGVKRLAVRATYTLAGNNPASTQDYTCSDIGYQPILVTLTEAASGATTTVTSSVNVVAPPAATITATSPNPARPGQMVTVTGINLSGATGLTVNGATTTISGLTSTSFSFVVPATAPGTSTLALSAPCQSPANATFGVLPSISSISPASESLGATISLTGAALNGATAIAFGGSSNNVVTSGFSISAAGTQITGIVVPNGAQTGTLTVTTPVGTSPASSQVFTVLTAPTISGFTPASGPVGATVGLTGTNLQGVTAVAFAGTSGNVVTTGFTVSPDGTSIAGIVVPNGAQTGTLTATRAGGIGATSSQSFTVCRVAAVVQSTLTLNLNAVTGTGTIAASAFNNGSTSNCGGTVTATLLKGGMAYTSASENYNAFITAPAGTRFTSVGFASYGNPAGDNGDFVLGSCHAASSQATVESLLLGRTGTIAVGASNYIFGGDPCPGTAKRVAVRAYYVPTSGSGGTASLAFSCSEVGPQPVLVVLTDATSGAVTLVPATVNVVAPPAATIATLSPSPALPGQTVSATGTNLAQATALTVNGAAAAISGLTNTGFSFVVPAGATATGSVVLSVPCTAATRAFAVLPVISSFTPTSGSTGTTVSITGTGLNGATAITFGGSSNNVVTSGFAVNAAGTQITGIVVPAGVQTGPLSVTTAVGVAGTSALSPSNFTVVPRPAISSFLPAQGAAGTSVQLTGTNLTGATTVRVNGVDTPATNVTSTSLTFVVPAGGSTTQSITVATAVSVSLPSTAFTVRLQVLSTSPAANGLNASWTTPAIGLTFSEPLNSYGLYYIGLFGSQTVPNDLYANNYGGIWSVSGNTVSFGLRSGASFNPFKPGEVISVSVTNRVQSLGGLASQPRVYQFTNATGGTGRGSFQPFATPTLGAITNDVTLFDVDHDGDLDMLSVGFDNNVVNVGYNNGTGTFTSNTNSSIGLGTYSYPNSIAVGQYRLDDGAVLIAAASEYSDAVSIVYADGQNYYYDTDVAVGSGPQQVVLGDVNGDGATDLLTANAYAGTVSVRLQDYYGFIAPATNPEVAVDPGAVKLALSDIDGDGDLDFVCLNNNSNSTVSVRRNDGTGNFTPPATNANFIVVSNDYSGSGGLVLGDVNGDGYPDLLTANYTAKTVSVRLNDGLGNFPTAASSTFGGSNTVRDMKLGDVDADGDLDLVTSNNTNSLGNVFLNDGQGQFTARPMAGPATGASSSLALGDVDGDGDLDLVTGIRYSGQLTVALNQCALPEATATTQTKALDARGLAAVAASAFAGATATACGQPLTVQVQALVPQGSVSGTAQETTGLTLTAPAGTIFTSVTFASFGTPTGSAGSYVQGSCHATTSQQVVESSLIGKGGSITILATNATFGGDPCGNTAKNLRVTATYSTLGAATDSLRYTCTELGAHQVLITRSAAGITEQTLGSVVVTAPAPAALATWRGTTSSDWADCRNWSYGQVPTASTNVLLPADRPNYPSLPAGTFDLNGLTLAAGARLTTAAGTTLQVRGDWTNQGGTATLAGPVVLLGSAAQVLGGSAPLAFATFTVNKPAGLVALTQDLNIASALTLSSGTLRTGTARITLAPTATISETETSYVAGIVQTTRTLSTAGTGSSFGGLGVELTPAGSSTVLPGSTVVERRTGASVSGLTGIGRYFSITPAVDAGLSVTLVLSYFDHELNGLAKGSLQLYKSDVGASGPWATVAGASYNALANTVTRDGIASLSVWTLGTGGPLPVELLSFTAEKRGTAVALAWATASEKNADRFEVERSRDGRTFERIGQVAAQGNATSRTSYDFLDAKYPGETNLLYYRLRQVDRDGTFSYSPVRTVAVGGKTVLALFPNPTTAGTTLTGAAPGTVVQVYDALGREVASAKADATGTAVLALPAGSAAGVYVVRAGATALRLTVE